MITIQTILIIIVDTGLSTKMSQLIIKTSKRATSPFFGKIDNHEPSDRLRLCSVPTKTCSYQIAPSNLLNNPPYATSCFQCNENLNCTVKSSL